MSLHGHAATATTQNGTSGESASLSPSLSPGALRKLGPAYELKFLLLPDQAREVEERLLAALLPDPHCDPALGGMYAITSLNCDTPDFGVFFRDERLRNRKYRVRRYGQSHQIFLERKRSRAGRVRKRRIGAAVEDLGPIALGRADQVEHSWFVRELRAKEFAPVCCVRYLRRALFGACGEGPMRVTFDHEIRGSLARRWSLEPQGDESPLLSGRVVCEFKFHNSMPAPLKAVAAAMRLQPSGVSKYRTCVRAFAAELGVEVPAAPATGAPHA